MQHMQGSRSMGNNNISQSSGGYTNPSNGGMMGGQPSYQNFQYSQQGIPNQSTPSGGGGQGGGGGTSGTAGNNIGNTSNQLIYDPQLQSQNLPQGQPQQGQYNQRSHLQQGTYPSQSTAQGMAPS